MDSEHEKATRPEDAEEGSGGARAAGTAAPENTSAFPIVGIGASAGGLEALELFLKHVPERSGMAFVILQHLDPTHKGILVELLQRTTRIPVAQVRDRQKVAPDRVYVIPPNKDMSILHGVLHLLEPAAPPGLRLPIDFFFRSLADDCETRSIGVILGEASSTVSVHAENGCDKRDDEGRRRRRGIPAKGLIMELEIVI